MTVNNSRYNNLFRNAFIIERNIQFFIEDTTKMNCALFKSINGRIIFVTRDLISKFSTFNFKKNCIIASKKLNLDDHTIFQGNGNLKISTLSNTIRGKVRINGTLIINAYNTDTKIYMTIHAREVKIFHKGKCSFRGSCNVPILKKHNYGTYYTNFEVMRFNFLDHIWNRVSSFFVDNASSLFEFMTPWFCKGDPDFFRVYPEFLRSRKFD